MAKEKAKDEGKGKGEGKSKKHLASVTHHRMKDGSFVHEHTYKDSPESEFTHPPQMVGTSPTLEDVKQHLDDHWGGGDGTADAGSGEGEGGEAQGPAAGAEPQPAAGQGEADEEEA